jgi:hypothetical protein
LDFQRRGGCALAFAKIVNTIRATFATADAEEEMPPPPLPPLPATDWPIAEDDGVEPFVVTPGVVTAFHESSAGDSVDAYVSLGEEAVAKPLAPLIQSIARCSDDSETQAEVASTLQATVEGEPDLAPQLCTDIVRGGFEKLLGAGAFCVAYRAARSLCVLAQYPGIADLLLDTALPQLTRLVLAKLEERATMRAVKEQLALSLYRLAQHRTESLAGSAVWDLVSAVENVLYDPKMAGTEQVLTRSRLQEALATFRTNPAGIPEPMKGLQFGGPFYPVQHRVAQVPC